MVAIVVLYAGGGTTELLLYAGIDAVVAIVVLYAGAVVVLEAFVVE